MTKKLKIEDSNPFECRMIIKRLGDFNLKSIAVSLLLMPVVWKFSQFLLERIFSHQVNHLEKLPVFFQFMFPLLLAELLFYLLSLFSSKAKLAVPARNKRGFFGYKLYLSLLQKSEFRLFDAIFSSFVYFVPFFALGATQNTIFALFAFLALTVVLRNGDLRIRQQTHFWSYIFREKYLL